MIERILLDEAGQPLLNLFRRDMDTAHFVKTEGFPDLVPVGTVEDVPGTGLRLYVGPDLFKAGQYTLSIGTHGKNHDLAFALQREIISAATKTRGIWRSGGVLPIARFSSIKRSFSGSAMFGGTVDVTFEAASPYWWGKAVNQVVNPGAAAMVQVRGDARAALQVSITAGSQSVTDPSIVSDAGLTTWHGTISAGRTLSIDGRPGVWAVTLGGADVRLGLTGPQPYLEPGNRAVTVTAPGATVQLGWREGWLAGGEGVPLPELPGTGTGDEQWKQEDWR